MADISSSFLLFLRGLLFQIFDCFHLSAIFKVYFQTCVNTIAFFVNRLSFITHLQNNWAENRESSHLLPHFLPAIIPATFSIVHSFVITESCSLKSMVYIKAHSLCCIFYGFWQRQNGAYSSLQGDAHEFPSPKNPCASPVHFHFPLAFGNPFILSSFP